MIGLGDRVPMFKLRPYSGLLVAALFVGVIGGLISTYFFIEDAYDSSIHRGLFTVIFTVIIVVFLLIAAYSRYGFSHLKHHRPGYKRG